jgi:hypothetical protein
MFDMPALQHKHLTSDVARHENLRNLNQAKVEAMLLAATNSHTTLSTHNVCHKNFHGILQRVH